MGLFQDAEIPVRDVICRNDRGEEHVVAEPATDVDLQGVLAWFRERDARRLIGDAVEDAIYYVLDGARTHRFDVMDESVDSDERRAIGTKLQYHVLENFGLPKRRHPDTEVAGIGLEIKGTIGDNWAIPNEGQCGLTLLIQLDVRADRQRAFLMRTHRCWLRDGANHDGKRGVISAALERHSVGMYPWTSLRPNPLKLLRPGDREKVFNSQGQEARLQQLFTVLPHTTIPRAILLTVCAGTHDPMRRVRAIRARLRQRNIELLCGKWTAQRELAEELGYDLTGAAWVAVLRDEIDGHGELTARVLAEIGFDRP